MASSIQSSPKTKLTSEQRDEIAVQRIAREALELAGWDGIEGEWFWLSFADRNGFNGVSIVKAPSAVKAVLVAKQRGCWAPGQVAIQSVEENMLKRAQPDWTFRLLNRTEADALK